MTRKLALLLISSLCAVGLAQGALAAQSFTAKVIAVLDGDTLLVTRAGKPLKLRLAEIDAPEVGHAGMGGKPPNSQKAQPFGAESARSLTELVMGRQVQVESRAVDSYGRTVAIVSIDGLNVNHEQVRRGMAWEYSRFHSNRPLVTLQREAQQARRGLWSRNDNIEPTQWRKQHPSTPVADKTVSNDCGNQHCSVFVSCAEARRYFARCGGKMLDGDGDGKPCERLCAAEGIKPR